MSQPFNIPNLLHNNPNNTIVVVGSNHPTSKSFEIKGTGFKSIATDSHTLPKIQNKFSTETPQPPQRLDVETPDTFNTLYKEPFTISDRALPGLSAALNMDFEPQFLMLTTTGIDGGDLV